MEDKYKGKDPSIGEMVATLLSDNILLLATGMRQKNPQAYFKLLTKAREIKKHGALLQAFSLAELVRDKEGLWFCEECLHHWIGPLNEKLCKKCSKRLP